MQSSFDVQSKELYIKNAKLSDLEKQVHTQQDTICSLRRQLEDLQHALADMSSEDQHTMCRESMEAARVELQKAVKAKLDLERALSQAQQQQTSSGKSVDL